MSEKPKYDTREKWMLEAVRLMTPLFVTRKWLEFGAPICPLKGHGPMKFDESVLEGDDE